VASCRQDSDLVLFAYGSRSKQHKISRRRPPPSPNRAPPGIEGLLYGVITAFGRPVTAGAWGLTVRHVDAGVETHGDVDVETHGDVDVETIGRVAGIRTVRAGKP
jgi:hypothetical protein